ncbi:hypothetical protein, partial [Pseudovibrio sp. POLY-S9]|uniref:hypothetical protein n=1 Tax=Pseudovibrio sp. POLY-S9 TaxID=1576596 RepID=UPI001AD8D61F
GKSSTTDPVIGTPNEHAFEVAYTALLSNLRHAERHGVQVDWEPDLETLLEMEAFMNSAPSAPLEAVAMQLYRLGLYPTPRFAPAHRVALSLYCLTYRAWCLFHQAQLKAVEAKPTAWIVPIEDTTLELTDGPLALSELALRSRPR